MAPSTWSSGGVWERKADSRQRGKWSENAGRVYEALAGFGAPLSDLRTEDLSTPGTIFQIGVEPNRIDLLTSVEGLELERAWQQRVTSTYGDIPIGLLSVDDLITNKRLVDRPQDRLDIAALVASMDRKPNE